MKPGLSDRLSRLKKVQGGTVGFSTAKTPPSAAFAGKKEEKIADGLTGDWRVLEQDLWYRERRCPSPLKDFSSSGLLVDDYPPRESWLFYDTETTGLSGGAGNTAFLVGLGREQGDEFVISQYFLSDYPGEPALLEYLKKEIDKSRLFISYNGKSFDKPLLETRFLMNRISCRMGTQLDLLYPVRSFFRDRMPNCRLGTVEEFLLDIHRIDDIPGSEIPEIWFYFLKNGNHPDLNKVMIHNDMDIHSLAVLLVSLEKYIMQPDTQELGNSFSIGRFLLDRGDEDRAVRLLQDAVDKEDYRAEFLLSLHWKRREEWQKALDLWDGILQKRLSLFASIEKAKYLEHKIRNIPEALELTESLLKGLPLSKEQRGMILHRKARLIRKLNQNIADSSSEIVE